MRKRLVGLFSLLFLLTTTNSTLAASKSDLVLKGFQTYVSTAKLGIINATQKYNTAAQKYNADAAIIDETRATSVQVAKSSYYQETLNAKNLYEPQINASNQSIKEAQVKLLTVNQVRVLKLGTNRNYWGNLNCPTTRVECKSLDDKGELFRLGEVTTLKSVMGERADYLYEIQLMIDLGLIEMLNSVEYQKCATIIRFEPDKIKSINSLWVTANSSAKIKQDNSIQNATYVAARPMAELNNKFELDKLAFETDKLAFEKKILAGNSAIRAAKRASKSPAVFDKAFVTAYKFEYNVKQLDDVANLPFSSLDTLRSLLSQYTIIELADEAAGIDALYSYLAAEKINKSVGNAFTSDKEFQEKARLVAAQYKKLTKVSLKF